MSIPPSDHGGHSGRDGFSCPHRGPETVLAYLSRYTHRVAIANSRLISLDDSGVTFKWKDYRGKGRVRYTTMTLTPHEFIRRFLLHVQIGRASCRERV